MASLSVAPLEDLTHAVTLRDELGKGSMFHVYNGVFKNSPCVVKFCRQRSEETTAILQGEYDLQHDFNSISPTHVPKPIAYGKYNGDCISITEKASGDTLFEFFRNVRLSTQKSFQLVYNIAKELNRWESFKMIHSDPHMCNIIIDPKNVQNYKIIDFDMSSDLGTRFFSKGRIHHGLDVNLFLYSVFYYSKKFKNKTFSAAIRRILRPHINRIRLTVQGVHPSDWLDECRVKYAGKTYMFSHYKNNHVYFFDPKADAAAKVLPIAAPAEKVWIVTNTPHLCYYFAHIKLPVFNIEHLNLKKRKHSAVYPVA